MSFIDLIYCKIQTVDQYKNYIQNLKSRGFSTEQITRTLSLQGIDQATIDQLMGVNAVTSSSPPTLNKSAFIAQNPTPPPEAYVDYIKALLSRGASPQEVDAHLAQYSIDLPTRSAAIELARKAQTPQNYPLSTPMQTSNTAMGQAPVSSGLLDPENDSLEGTGSGIGWLLTIISCIVPALFLAFDAPGKFANSTQILVILSMISATIGLNLYVLNVLLATRLKFIEDWFGGLNKVYIAHAIIGSASLSFIMLHPVLLAISYLPLGIHAAAGLFVPSLTYIYTAFGIFALGLMLVLLFLTLYVHLPYRVWLASHKYLGIAFILICLHILFSPNPITENSFVRYYFIALVIIGSAALVYRTLLPNVFIRRYVYLLHAVTQKTQGVVDVTLTPTTKTINFRAGQFIFLSFQADGISPEWHPFTIVSPPNPQTLDIDIKSLGGYTETLTRLLPDMVGMSVLIEGAYGRFSFRNFRNANQVWIAAGIGITPFLSMAQNLGKGPYNIDLYYSVRSEAELIDLDKLMRAQQHQSDKFFRVFPFVTQKYNRHLSADLIAATSGDLSKRDFLICGPSPMMSSMKEQLLKMGIKKYKIHTEDFSIT